MTAPVTPMSDAPHACRRGVMEGMLTPWAEHLASVTTCCVATKANQ